MKHTMAVVLSILMLMCAALFCPVSAAEAAVQEIGVIEDLFLQLMTRPGVTSDIDARVLRYAARDAAIAFQRSLLYDAPGKIAWPQFRSDLKQLLITYKSAYSAAPAGTEGAEAKGNAVDSLFDGLLSLAAAAGISGDKIDMAILRGAATAENAISKAPLSTRLSPSDQELAKLLLRITIDQAHRRVFMDGIRNALITINAPAEIEQYFNNNVYAWLRPALRQELPPLEEIFSDPSNLTDPQNLVMIQFNNEVISELFSTIYVIKLSTTAVSPVFLEEFATRMPGMTVGDLQFRGILPAQFPFLPLTSLAAFYSVTADTQLAYTPVLGLAERLTLLGGTPPSPPDVRQIDFPFRSLFLLAYDINLSDLITAKEWDIALLPEDTAPQSMIERLVIKEAERARLAKIRASIRKLPEDMRDTLMLLLRSPFAMGL